MDSVRRQLRKLLYSDQTEEVSRSELQEIVRRLEEVEGNNFEMSDVVPLFIYQVEYISKITRLSEEEVVKKIVDNSFSITEVRHIVHSIIKGNGHE